MKYTSALFLAFALFGGTNSIAATRTSSQSGNWSATTTWGGNPAPVTGDVAIVNGGFTVTVDVPNAACSSMQLGGGAVNTGDGTLLFASGSQVTVSGVVTVGVGNRKGSVAMTGGGTLLCEGFILNSLGTWTPGTGMVELAASSILPNNGITSFNNLTLSGGTTTLNANTTLTGNLLINPAGTLDGAINQLTVGGNWTNNGTFTGNTGTVIFNKNGNQSITGAGANNFNLIRLNMGTSSANILEVLSTNFSAPDGFLTLSNGTFKVSGTFSLASTFIPGPIYNIQPTAGLWINNPNVTVTAQAGGVSVRGVLRMTAGTYNIGTTIDNNLDYVAGASINIEGGELNVAGHLGRNNAASSVSYTQSGGTVSVVTKGSTDIVFGGFDIGAAASSFTMSGGTIVISNATSNAIDYLNFASVSNVTGGTLQVGDATSGNAQTIRIQSSAPVGSLLISNATSQGTKPTARLSSSLNVTGGITIQPGATLDANGLNISLGGDWLDNGTFTAGPTVTFNGSSAQRMTKAGGETFNALIVTKSIGALTLNNSATVNGAFSLTEGTLAIGNNSLTLNGTVSGGGTLASSSAGSVNYNQASTGQAVLAGNYGNLVFSNFNKTLASTGSIGVAGTFTSGSAQGHTVAGSTIDFNGGTQSVPSFTYHNLTLSGNGTKTSTGVLTVNGNLTNNAGIVFTTPTILNLNGTTHTNGGTLSAATLAIGSGAILTNNGTVTASTSLTGSGTLTQGATGILNIGGTADITTLNISAAGNTVNYSGAGQAVRSAAYHNLALIGSGVPVLAGVNAISGNFVVSGTVATAAATGMTIVGNVSVGAGASFDAGAFSHSLSGNLSNAGTFNAGTGTFTFSGSSAQTTVGATFHILVINNGGGVSMLSDGSVTNALTLANGAFSIGAHTLTLNGALSIGSGSLVGGASSNVVVGGSAGTITLPAITLNNLTLNRANGGVLGGDATITGALTITNGTLTTGVNSIILGPAATLTEVAGQPVLGTVKTTRTVTATFGTESFGNIGADIILNGTAPGVTTLLRKTGTASSGKGHSSVRRYFDITPATNTGLNAGLVFHYDASELNGQNANILELYRSRDNGTTWNNQGGSVISSSRTISIAGVNDLSRWTASDTSNSIGNTAAPTTGSISPNATSAGAPAFTLVINGTDFVNGKSAVRFNGSNRATTYVSTTQLTAAIPASDLQIAGAYPVTVFNSGGGLSNAQTFTVNAAAAARVRVETAANGSGTVVPARSLASGSPITVYAVTRDSLGNFIANVAADAWNVQNVGGGVVSGDLVSAADRKSAVFTAHVIGTADIVASSGSLALTASGTITITAGTPARVRVETAANGSGTVAPAESLAVGSSITVFAVTRDSSNNFVTNVAADSWSLQNIAGGIVASDLLPAPDRKSAVFTGHAAGSANIRSGLGALTTTTSGTITVRPSTGVAETEQPHAFALEQNYPNPFNPTTTIRFSVGAPGHTTLKVFDALGNEVATLAAEELPAGTYTRQWNASGLASGVYFARFAATDANGSVRLNKVSKLLLLK